MLMHQPSKCHSSCWCIGAIISWQPSLACTFCHTAHSHRLLLLQLLLLAFAPCMAPQLFSGMPLATGDTNLLGTLRTTWLAQCTLPYMDVTLLKSMTCSSNRHQDTVGDYQPFRGPCSAKCIS